MEKFRNKAHVHFIGIGGIGMSGIAEILLSLGQNVSGSDLALNSSTQKLIELGATVYQGHQKNNIKDATVVVYSSAVTFDNPEMVEAKEKSIPVMRRAEMLAELMRLKKGIAVAGTHGKTTTTSILATILDDSSYDPTYIIGGIVSNLKGHARIGKGDYLVAEADESDGSFLLLNPILSIITNIDDDHLDFYKNQENLHEAFLEFSNKVPFYGLCSVNINDENVRSLIPKMRKPFCTFGIKGETKNIIPDFEASEITNTNLGASFKLKYNENDCGVFLIKTPGKHNVLNAVGAISLAHFLGLSFESIKKGITKFDGVGRRFQSLFSNKTMEIIDDYGHHPTEILATIQTAKSARIGKKIIVIFEPHRFSRTRDCWNQFLHCFNDADQVYMSPIYAASEKSIDGISALNLAKDINNIHPNKIKLLDSIEDMSKLIFNYKDKSCVLLTLGAGSIGKEIRNQVKSLDA